MEPSKLRRVIDALASEGGFSKTRSIWFRVTPETIVGLGLQRSGYSQLYYLNLNVWIQGLWNRSYSVSEVVGETGHIFRREPPEFSDAFDLDNDIKPSVREARIQELFRSLVIPLSLELGTRAGIREVARREPAVIHVLPAVREQLYVRVRLA